MKSLRLHKKRAGAKLGQHLLTNAGIARAVALAAGIAPNDRVLEIGPGKGMLTKELLLLGARVTAVEKDSTMVQILKEQFGEAIHSGALTLIEGDAREYTPDTVFPREAYKVAANIPYYITGELLRTALSAHNKPTTLAFLIQKEVAERIARSRKESILSISVKAYGIPKYIKTVSRGSFNPPPSVDSAILAVQEISGKKFETISEKLFFSIVKAGFAQRRKTLLGNLKRAFPKSNVESLFERCDLDKKIRAEDVAVGEWLRLTESMQNA